MRTRPTNRLMRMLLALTISIPIIGAAACASAGGGTGGAPANAFVGAWVGTRLGQGSDTLRIFAGGRAESNSMGPAGRLALTYELPDATRIRISGYPRDGVGEGTLGEEGMVLPLTIRRTGGSVGYFPYRRVK